MAGFFAGLVLGDVSTGLVVGGTLNLLVLGIGNFGGASIPDYMTGALLGAAFAIQSGQEAEFGVTLAIPISAGIWRPRNMTVTARDFFFTACTHMGRERAWMSRTFGEISFIWKGCSGF